MNPMPGKPLRTMASRDGEAVMSTSISPGRELGLYLIVGSPSLWQRVDFNKSEVQ